ncbi:hypothetical protein [Gillisia sp. Hel_I_86]|uniref:hypothetical protein n=1 Tax=Gillisia sp. Hel_I_86 TaxID=1249981 RepID=UPI0011AA28EC|nr:hypothetical protein [Gillisia sp. Hel_I_86]
MNLEKYKNKPGFKIPHNSMENLETTLFEKLEITSTKGKESKSGFQVPAGYFDTLEHIIQAKLNSENKRGKTIKLFSKKQLYYASAIAAIFIVLLSTVLLKSPQDSGLDTLDYATLEAYIEEDLNYTDISNLIYEDGLNIDNIHSFSFSEDAIFDYLSEHVEDSGLIIE